MAEDTTRIKAGYETTEHAIAKSASTQGWVGMIVGTLIAVGPLLLGFVKDGSVAFAIIGGVIAVATQLRALVSDGSYIHSRTEVKISADTARVAALISREGKIE